MLCFALKFPVREALCKAAQKEEGEGQASFNPLAGGESQSQPHSPFSLQGTSPMRERGREPPGNRKGRASEPAKSHDKEGREGESHDLFCSVLLVAVRLQSLDGHEFGRLASSACVPSFLPAFLLCLLACLLAPRTKPREILAHAIPTEISF